MGGHVASAHSFNQFGLDLVAGFAGRCVSGKGLTTCEGSGKSDGGEVRAFHHDWISFKV
jgi:hypothetical protein